MSNSPCSLRSQTMSNNRKTTWMHGNRKLRPNFQNSWPCYNQQTNCKSQMLLKQKQWWNSQNKEKFTGISQYQNHKYFWTNRSCAHTIAECRHKIMPNLSNILGGLSVAFYWLKEWIFRTPENVIAMNMPFAHLKPPHCNIYCGCPVSHGLIGQIECTCSHGLEYSPLRSPPWIIVSPCVNFGNYNVMWNYSLVQCFVRLAMEILSDVISFRE